MIDIVSRLALAALAAVGRTASLAFLLRALIHTVSTDSIVAVNAGIAEVDIGEVAVLAPVVSTRVALAAGAGVNTVGIEAGETDTARSAGGAGVEANIADASIARGNEVAQAGAANIGR